MKHLFLVLMLMVAIQIPPQAQEIVTLTTPITKNQTTVRIVRLIIDVSAKSVIIEFVGNNGEAGTAYYTTPPPLNSPAQPTGAQLINTLNTANLSSNSLMRRVLTRLQTDAYIGAGAVSGTPE
jgi:hypothetical protein